MRNASAAAIFTNPRLRRLLLWFSHSPKSVGEAAAAWGMDPRRAHYYIGRLVGLKLLRVVEERARAGRAVKYYRAASDAFFISNEAAPKGFGDELSRELRDGLAIEAARSGGGMLFKAAANGSPRGRVVRGTATSPKAIEFWRVLKLRPQDVEAFAREVNALLNRFQRSDTHAGSQTYLVHAALAPRRGLEGVADNAG